MVIARRIYTFSSPPSMLFSISFILVDLLDFPLFISYFLLIFHILPFSKVSVCVLYEVLLFLYFQLKEHLYLFYFWSCCVGIIFILRFTILLYCMQTCFFRQFGRSVVRADYLTLRKGFIMVGDILTHTRHSFSLAYDDFTFKHTNVF